ncbi:hypothetical protein CRE_27961 [Caenorhabditis remanei]|uniref:Acyltransferase 3 domain-containing protein n=1 Tax=Caenorhabditis remanei TaxID=31234 RepID=E3NQQ7_CAERE|nr:hypothetical protein CRE_27961 [Caenorhabditis remanei]
MRQDIQCLRGLAIIFVLSFHLSPNLFVNGYLGVDIFFVISGFLMAKNLTNLNLLDVHDFLKFYYKRFRRILPLYYLTCFIIVIMVHLYLPDFLWKNNNRYSLASLFLITNQLVIHDQGDYFTEFLSSASSMNAFLHLWSLSVEMQFYLLVPFIFLGMQFLKKDYLKLMAVTLITIFGFIGFAMILDKFAFNFLFLRLWQFSAGFIALFYIKIREARLLPKKSETADEGKTKFTSPISQHDLVISALSILALCMLPNVIPKLILRPLVTLATSLIIGCQSQDLRILNSKTLSYIGDVSYVLYLVHWPVISIFLTATVHSYLFCIVLIFILSIVLHHLFEKQYLKLEMKGIFPLVLLLIATNAYLQYSIRNDSFWKYQYTPEEKSIIERNHETYAPLYDIETRQSKCMEKDLEVEFEKHYLLGYCRFPPGKGNTSVMLIGNSYILTFVNQIEEHFKLNYTEFRYLSIIGSYGIFASSWKLSHQALELSRKQVELHKPDVLFVLPRYMQDANYPTEENDKLVAEMNSNIEFYERFTKRIYILDVLPNWSENFQTLFLQNFITRPDDMELLHLNKKKADLEMKNIRRRLKMIKCNKCKVFDLSQVFLEDDKYLTFDRDTLLSYIDNTVHLNAAGVRPCDTAFKNLTREIMDSL